MTGVVGCRHSSQFIKELLKMLHPTLRSATVIGLISCVAGLRAETASEQLKSATIVLDEILSAPDKGIPQGLLRSRRAGRQESCLRNWWKVWTGIHILP